MAIESRRIHDQLPRVGFGAWVADVVVVGATVVVDVRRVIEVAVAGGAMRRGPLEVVVVVVASSGSAVAEVVGDAGVVVSVWAVVDVAAARDAVSEAESAAHADTDETSAAKRARV